MATGYSREQLAEMARAMLADAPPIVTTEDKRLAEHVSDLSMAGTDLGILLWLVDKDEHIADLFINCALALELVICIIAAKDAQNWEWTEARHMTKLKEMPSTEGDLTAAWRITSCEWGRIIKGLHLRRRMAPLHADFTYGANCGPRCWPSLIRPMTVPAGGAIRCSCAQMMDRNCNETGNLD